MCCQFLNLWRILGSTLDCFIIGLRLSFCRSAVFHSENVVVSPFTIIFLVSLCGFVFLFVFLYLNLYWCFSGVSRGNEVRAFSLHFSSRRCYCFICLILLDPAAIANLAEVASGLCGCGAVFSAHFSKPVCDTWIPMFSSISESLALTDFTIYFSSNSFSFFFTKPSLLLLTWPCVLPSALFSSLLDYPKVHTSRTALLQNCAGWWEGVPSPRTEFWTLPLLAMRPQSQSRLRTWSCKVVIYDMRIQWEDRSTEYVQLIKHSYFTFSFDCFLFVFPS